ncbi:MAG TPA: lysylphosphatidylglycerol synthase domain-containing protein [Planctomycetia bacterium]|nr:lysylphosphatidylglycerol synthase domain-containing protein [Planctomycetia bacterium]
MEAESAVETGSRRRPPWLRLGMQLAVGGLAFVMLYRHFAAAAIEHQERAGTIKVDWSLIAVAAALYAVAWSLQSAPWVLVARRVPEGTVSTPRLIGVYLASHLGKYVPGKAMVLAIRAILLPRGAYPLRFVILASVYETFSTMASGALLGLVALMAAPSASQALLMFASFSAVGFGFAIWPTVFAKLTAWWKPGEGGAEAAPPQPLHVRGQAIGVCAWLVMGASFMVVGRAAGLEAESALAVAAVPLANIAGFLSMVPGHFLVREWVLVAALQPLLGSDLAALVLAGLFRVVSLAVEAIGGAIAYALVLRRPAA